MKMDMFGKKPDEQFIEHKSNNSNQGKDPNFKPLIFKCSFTKNPNNAQNIIGR